MRTNQRLPPLFEPHTHWILQVFEEDAIPKAWIFIMIGGKCTPHIKRVDSLNTLNARYSDNERIGILQFYATISSSNKDYTVLYLYDGEQFSHTIFHPRSQPEHSLVQNSGGWNLGTSSM